jgi:hypothetical protein
MQGVEGPPLELGDKLRYLCFRILFLLVQLFPLFETLGSVLLILHFQSLPPPAVAAMQCPWSSREQSKSKMGLEQTGGSHRGRGWCGLGTILSVLAVYVITVSGLVVALIYFAAAWAVAPTDSPPW